MPEVPRWRTRIHHERFEREFLSHGPLYVPVDSEHISRILLYSIARRITSTGILILYPALDEEAAVRLGPGPPLQPW